MLLPQALQTESLALLNEPPPPLSEETKEAYYQTLSWLASPEAHQYDLTVKNIPLNGPSDVAGNFELFTKKLEPLITDLSSLRLMYPQIEEDKAALLKIFRRLSPEQQQTLVLDTMHRPTAVGDRISLIHFLDSGGHLFVDAIDDGELADLFTAIPAVSDQVKWDGELSRFVYQDSQLDYRVALIAQITKKSPERSLKVFNTLPAEVRAKFQINLNTEDPKTHVEPFDLVQGSVVRLYHNALQSVEMMSRIVVTKMVHRRLFKLWSLDPANDLRGAGLADAAIYQPINAGNRAETLLSCAGEAKLLNNSDDIVFSIVPGLINFSSVKAEKIYQSGGKAKFICDGLVYPLKITPVAADPLSLPEPYDIQKIAAKAPVSVLVNYALTEETNSRLIATTIAYMTSRGYRYTGMERKVKSLEVFKSAFTHADIFVPAAHVIDINHLQLGTEYSRVLHFSRSFRHASGAMIPVNLTAIFPESKGENGNYGAALNVQQLGELLALRRPHLPHSMFVLTQSCHSGSAVIPWTNAFRRSVDIDIAAGRLSSASEARDLIHAIAPEGGFPTNAPSELLLDFIPSLMSIEMLAQGQSPRQVFETLKKPIKPDLFTKAIATIEKWFGKKARGDLNLELKPVYNIDLPYLLDSSGFVVEMGPGERP